MNYVFLSVAILILILVTLKYPIISLGLFLTTSVLKGVLMVNFPFFRTVDFTVLCGAYTLAAMAYSFVHRRGRVRDIFSVPILLYILLAILLLVSVAYSSSPRYGWEKSSRFATLGMIALLAPIVFVRDIKDVRILFYLLIGVGIALAITTMVAPDVAVVRKAAESRGSFFEADPLETATRIGVAAILVFSFVVMSRTALVARAASAGIIYLCVVAIVVTASRGPFAGLLLTWLAALFIFRKGISKVWLPVAGAAVCLAVIIPFVVMPARTTERIRHMFVGGDRIADTVYTRSPRFSFAWQNSWRSPVFGHGTGAFAQDWAGHDERSYPHNMILELFYENGVVGVTIGMAFLIAILVRWRRAANIVYTYGFSIKEYHAVHVAGLLFIYTLMQAMKSGDLDGNRFMFFCSGLVIAAQGLVQRQAGDLFERYDYDQLVDPSVCCEGVEAYEAL